MSKKDKELKKTQKRKEIELKTIQQEQKLSKTPPKKKPPKKKPVVENLSEEKFEILTEPEVKNNKTTDPRLELVLGRIEADGKIEVKMDWNQEFLNQLRQRGFNSFKEEDAVMSFLNWMFIVRLSDTPDTAIENAIPLELKEALKNKSTTGEIITR